MVVNDPDPTERPDHLSLGYTLNGDVVLMVKFGEVTSRYQSPDHRVYVSEQQDEDSSFMVVVTMFEVKGERVR